MCEDEKKLARAFLTLFASSDIEKWNLSYKSYFQNVSVCTRPNRKPGLLAGDGQNFRRDFDFLQNHQNWLTK